MSKTQNENNDSVDSDSITFKIEGLINRLNRLQKIGDIAIVNTPLDNYSDALKEYKALKYNATHTKQFSSPADKAAFLSDLNKYQAIIAFRAGKDASTYLKAWEKNTSTNADDFMTGLQTILEGRIKFLQENGNITKINEPLDSSEYKSSKSIYDSLVKTIKDKNPLTPIHLASERLFRKFGNQVEDKAEFYKYIQMIVRHTDDIKKIVSEFVNFARLPAPVFTDCDLVILIKNMVESRKLINDKILYKFITTDQHIDFICETTQINQIMVNLLKNAEESLGITKLQQGVIIVSIAKSDHQIIITVDDNGVGFQENLIDRATEPYITTRSKGTGLGLAIIKKIAQDHCATLELANRLEGGAIINITFNLDELKLKTNNSKQNIL